MSVKAVQPSLTPKQNLNAEKTNQSNNVSFKGSYNPVVLLMDAIDRGGFAASFIAQDGIGMVAPRIAEGLNRNRRNPETGKMEGPLNWEFARREGVREILSGPSAFIIPAGILAVIKKYSGTANNVPTDLINVYGENFAKLAKNKELISDTAKTKKLFTNTMIKNALETSTEGALKGKELEKTADEFTELLGKIENAKNKGFLKNVLGKQVKDSKQDLLAEATDKYMNIIKKYSLPSNNELAVALKFDGKDKKVGTSIGRLFSSINDYADDAIKHTQKYISKNPTEEIGAFVKNFNLRRIGTRAMSNGGMWLAVVGFYTLIPKLYNLGLKGDPGTKGLKKKQNTTEINNSKQNKDTQKDIAFKGGFQNIATKTGESVLNTNWLGKLSNSFEFNGASMSVPAMMTLLFGFCFPPRYANAKSDYERKEIVFRDLASFGAILFGAKALSRATSKVFSKLSGLALNTKPANHGKSILNKFKNYFSPGAGIDVLNSSRIVSKYSNLEGYKDGIQGFFKFIKENGGNVKKMLSLDKNVKANAETILENAFGKSKTLKTATEQEILEAFKKAEGTDALKKIYSTFSKSNNKFINIAKTCNSAFGFMSTLVLVPAFMIWVARTCEKMTKQRVAKEVAAEEAAKSITEQVKPQNQAQQASTQHMSHKVSMAGFLGAN